MALLEEIGSSGGILPADRFSMGRESAAALGRLLESKGLARFLVRTRRVLRLTERGKEAASGGLPEERLLRFLSSVGGAAGMARLRAAFSGSDREFNAALGRARKEGWISIERRGEETILMLARAPERYELREALNLVEGGEVGEDELDPEVAAELVRRGLASVHEEKEIYLELTDLGRDVLAGRIPVEREVAKLNRNLLESGRWREIRLKSYDVSSLPPPAYPGKPHPYSEFLDEVREILIGMGFLEVKSPIVEAEFWNFDALFQAQDHPAREVHDSYAVSKPSGPADVGDLDLVERVREAHESGGSTGSRGWGYRWSFDVARRLILRSQMTAASARTLAGTPNPPLKIFAIDRVFRPEALDRTHSMEFHQCEGVVLAEGLNVKHLLGYLAEFAKKLGFSEVRFRPAYFPFTEPSVEAYVRHPKMGWIEIAGSGLFRPEILVPMGYDYPRVQALAWGIGIGRLAMLKMGIGDIRDLHSQDLGFLRDFPIGRVIGVAGD